MILFQAQWGVVQFIKQGSINLSLLGETRITSFGSGVANFNADETKDGTNTKLLRGYGPYSHPNILGGVLVMGLVLLFRNVQQKNGYYFLVSLGLLIVALIISYSRAAWLAGGLVISGEILISLYKERRKAEWRRRLTVMVLIIIVFAQTIYYRQSDKNDRARQDRLQALEWAVELLRENGIWRGVGNGNYRIALADMLEEKQASVSSWEIDYVHVAPFVWIVEWGVVPTMLVITAGLIYLWRFMTYRSWWFLFATSPLWLLDHYLATQLAPAWWWLTICLLVGQAKVYGAAEVTGEGLR